MLQEGGGGTIGVTQLFAFNYNPILQDVHEVDELEHVLQEEWH